MSAGEDPPVTAERLQELLQCRDNPAPVPILKQRAETRVVRDLRDLAVKGCSEQVRALAHCTEGKMLSVIWHCRALSKAVDACMAVYTLDESLKDEMRRRYVLSFFSLILFSFWFPIPLR